MNWATERLITIKKKTPAEAPLKVRTPSGQVEDVSGNSYTAKKNGRYIFTMTVGDETMQRMIVVSRLDHTDPTLTLTDAGPAKDSEDEDILYHTLSMTATAADSESGIQSVKYCFSTGNTVPEAGSSSWQTATATDGVYVFEKTAASTTIETWYLHVMAEDKVGHVTTTSSPAYKLVQKQEVKVTLTGTSDWTQGNSTLTWKITNAGAGNCTVSMGEGAVSQETGKDTGATGTFTVANNGVYNISVTDKHGNTGSAFGVVNNIDREAPEFSVSVPDGFAQEKTVTLSGVTDKLTRQYNEKGGAGNDGSGVAKQEYQVPGTSGWATFTGDSFTVTKNGTYKVRLTDKVGNESVQDVEVSKIDTTPPEVTYKVNGTVNNGWYNATNLNITLTYSDDEGVTKLYAKMDDGEFTELSDISTAEGTSYTKTYACTEGEHTYTFKAVDVAGNVTEIKNVSVKWDKTKPEIGEITCDQKAKNFFDWIIGKESLIVSIPVKDSLSGVETLTYKQTTFTKDGQTTGETTKEVSLTEGQETVTLKFDAAWKGKIWDIKCTDTAGNISDSTESIKGAGNGIIVENDAPVVKITPPATATSGWYTTQFNIDVSVTDDNISSGIAGITWKKVENGTEKDEQTVEGLPGTTSISKKEFNISENTDGTHTYYVKAVDNAGNKSVGNEGEWQKVTVNVDQTKPVIETITCEKTAAKLTDWIIRNDKLTVSITVKDDTSGLKTLTYNETTFTGNVENTVPKKVSLSGGKQQTVTLTFNADWKGKITDIKCTDTAGNTSEPKNIEGAGNGIIVEDNAPVVTITPPTTATSGWYTTQFNIGVSVTDNNISGGIAGITWKKVENGTEQKEQTVEGLPGTTPISKKEFNILEKTDGTHTYYVKAVDNAGNKSSGNDGEWQTVTVKVDKTKPEIGEITCKEPENKEPAKISNWIIGKKKLIVSIPVKDATSGLKKLTYKKTTFTGNGQTTEEKEVPLSGMEKTVKLELPADWKGKITDIKCIDTAGNTSTSKSIEGNGIIVEDNAPVVTITPPTTVNANGWYNTNIDIAVSVTDDKGSSGAGIISGGIDKIIWKEGSAGEEQTVKVSHGPDAPECEEEFTIPVNPDGTHTYYVKAIDNAGNDSGWETVTVKMDQTPPTVNLDNMTVDKGKINLWAWITGKTSMIIRIPTSCITETPSGIEEVSYTATPDGSAEGKSETIQAKGGTYEIALAEEFSGTIKLTVKDKADNITQVTLPAENGKVIGEDYAPVVKIAPVESANKNGWYNKDIDIAVSVTDNKGSDDTEITSGGIAGITWKKVENGKEQEEKTEAGLPGTAPVYATGFTISEETNGTHTYYVKAVDNAGNKSIGNEGEWETVTVNVDKIKPEIGEITCEQKAANLFDWIIGKESLTVNIPVTDSLSGVETLTYDETTFTGGSETTVEKTVPVSENQKMVTLTFDADRKSKITDIRCTDKAGNTSDFKSIEGAGNGIIVEDNAPVVKFTKPDSNKNGWYNEDIAIDVSVTDNKDVNGAEMISGGIAEINWQKEENGAEQTIGGLPGTNALVPETGFTISEDTDGKHTYYVKAVDNAGNDSGWQTVTANVDKTPPAVEDLKDITVDNGKINLWAWITGKTSMIIKIPDSCITDALSGIEEVTYTATSDGSGEEKSETIQAKDGTYEIALDEEFSGTIKLTVKDKADNTTQVTLPAENGKVIGEDYAPVIKITKPAANENDWYKNQIIINVSVTDDKDSDDTAVTSGDTAITSGGIAEIKWKEGENGEEQTVEQTVAGLPETDRPVYGKEFNIPVDTDGEHTYYVKAVDNAGNDSGWQTVTAKLDTEKPKIGEITCEQKAVNIFDWIIGKDSMLITVPLTDNRQDGEPGSGVETVNYTLITADAGTDSDVDSPDSDVDSPDSDVDSPDSGVDTPGSGVDTPGSGVETVDDTLTTADTGTDSDADSPDSDADSLGSAEVVATGTAVVREAEDGTFTAEITVLPDFKGKVKVSALDKAGNVAEEKTLGVDDSEKKGIIVEDNAPDICFSVGGGEVSRSYYDAAPVVDISVDDTGSAKEQDGTDQTKTTALITGGIASVTCTITNGSKTVTHTPATKYEEAMKESDSFAIPADKLFFGINTITVTAVDNAGNKAEESIAVKVKKPDKDKKDDMLEGSAGGIDTPDGEKSSETPKVTPLQPEKKPEKPQREDKPEEKPQPEGTDAPDQGGTRPAQTKEPRIVLAFLDDGKIVVSGEPVSTGSVDGMGNTSTVLKLEDGAVIVTVVCKEQKCTAGVADTVAVANAVLTPEQIQLVADGETIEIRIDVEDISDKAPQQDKDVIERGIKENRKELPNLTIGMYVDISMFIKIGESDWNTITHTEELVDVVIGIPETLKAEGREFTIIRSHDGTYALLPDLDDNPDTITISTDLFSAYAIAYEQADGNLRCGLCHICPTFLGICYFIWLAVIVIAILLIIWILVRRRKKEEKEKQEK